MVPGSCALVPRSCHIDAVSYGPNLTPEAALWSHKLCYGPLKLDFGPQRVRHCIGDHRDQTPPMENLESKIIIWVNFNEWINPLLGTMFAQTKYFLEAAVKIRGSPNPVMIYGLK